MLAHSLSYCAQLAVEPLRDGLSQPISHVKEDIVLVTEHNILH